MKFKLSKQIGFCLFALVGCNGSLFFYPSQEIYTLPEQVNLAYDSVTFHSHDQTKLKGWLIHSQKKSSGIVIQFHGNAENMSSHFLTLAWLPKNRFDLFVFDYRGYGQSEGRPTIRGAIFDSIAAIEYIAKRFPDQPIILIGQSIGGALLLAALSENQNILKQAKIQAIVLEGTFASYQQIMQEKMKESWLLYPFQWLSYLVANDIYAPKNLIIKTQHIPYLIISGEDDQVVKPHHSDTLYQQIQGKKYRWSVPSGRHIDTFTRFGAIYRPRFEKLMHHLISKQT